MKKTLTYGQIPPRADFVKYTRRHFPFPMELVGTDRVIMIELLNDDEGLLSPNFNKTGITAYVPHAMSQKFGVKVEDPEAMFRLITALVRLYGEEDNEIAGNLASSILGVLGYEWI